jgi:hypothetical protein
MYTILNKTERLIHAPNGEMLPPGVTVTVSEDTMNHPQMQELSNQGALEVVEVDDAPDPPPPETLSGAMAGPRDPVTGVQKVNPEGETKATPTPTPTPAPTSTTTVNTKQSSKEA